jgi:hypothetical protein
MFYLLEIFILSIGLLMTIRPDVVWTIKESWKSNDATEPSDFYLLTTRIGGVLFLAAGLFAGIAYHLG